MTCIRRQPIRRVCLLRTCGLTRTTWVELFQCGSVVQPGWAEASGDPQCLGGQGKLRFAAGLPPLEHNLGGRQQAAAALLVR